ncbi:hypothetical protein CDL15_Pgr029184 [Punica granatum]|uniref:SET domain-containing protein n=1 Tax=Punica granatum TaxID=22663 RepID=A0A218XD05_PUNGR|nr:hypothetical protein CDL15_Pgr029184 [Punica granatum]
MLRLARNGGGFSSRLHPTILRRSTSLLRFSSTVSADSSSPEIATATNMERPGPPPIRVALTNSAGRGVFATRRIASGDLMHTASPVVCYPSLATLHSVCYFCLRRLPNATAAPTASYCSDECMEHAEAFHEVEAKADWLAHDEHCRLSRHTPASSVIFWDDFRVIVLNKQWYIGLLARIRINAFRVELAGGSYEDLLSLAAASVATEASVGNAVYMLPSFYNHDCDPNAHIIWLENASARLKALRDIDPGEELRICYIDASLDRDARRAILFEGFGFHCNCGRCLSGD